MIASRFAVAALSAVMLLLSSAVGNSALANKIVGKFGHTGASASDYGRICQEFAGRVNARSKGLEVQVFPDSQLGGTQALIEGVQLGTVHLSNAGYGSLGAFVTELGAMELPYIFGRTLNIEDVLKVTKSSLYEEWQQMLMQKIGARVVAPAWYYGHRDFLVKRPATKPQDLAGVKMRVVPAPIYVNIVRALGATPTPVDWPEVYNSLRSGLIDGVDSATDSLASMKFYEGAKHYLATHHITGLNAMIANARWYNGLSAEDKQILDEELLWFQREFARRLQDIKPEIIQQLRAQGVTIHDIDLNAFRNAVREAKVAERVAEAQKWRPDTLNRFSKVLKDAGFQPDF